MVDIIWISIISIIFLTLFVISEIAYKKGVNIETTRKFVHFSGAFVTIFFPFILKSHWSVLFLAVCFALIMFLSKKFNLLKSIHSVKRKTYGAFYHPIAIYICFLYAQYLNQSWFYVIAILILAVSDAIAALVGKNYGYKEYVVENGLNKTFEGSFSFFLSSFLIVHLILLLTSTIQRLECVLVALLISIIVTIFEGISLKGADNLFIPIGTIFILSKNINPTLEGLYFQLLALSVFLVGYLILMLPYKRIGFSGVILMGLINYIVWALMGNVYAIILFSFLFLCAKTNLILDYDCLDSDLYRVKPVFYILSVPLVCAFLVDFIGDIIIYPFLVSIICEGIIIKTKCFRGNLNKGLILTSIISIIALGASYAFIR